MVRLVARAWNSRSVKSVTRFAGSVLVNVIRGLLTPGFADSPGALLRHPLRGFKGIRELLPRVRGLTRGFIPSPASWVLCW